MGRIPPDESYGARLDRWRREREARVVAALRRLMPVDMGDSVVVLDRDDLIEELIEVYNDAHAAARKEVGR